MVTINADQLVAAEVTGDEVVATNDTTYIQMHLADYISSFPVEA